MKKTHFQSFPQETVVPAPEKEQTSQDQNLEKVRMLEDQVRNMMHRYMSVRAEKKIILEFPVNSWSLLKSNGIDSTKLRLDVPPVDVLEAAVSLLRGALAKIEQPKETGSGSENKKPRQQPAAEASPLKTEKEKIIKEIADQLEVMDELLSTIKELIKTYPKIAMKINPDAFSQTQHGFFELASQEGSSKNTTVALKAFSGVLNEKIIFLTSIIAQNPKQKNLTPAELQVQNDLEEEIMQKLAQLEDETQEIGKSSANVKRFFLNSIQNAKQAANPIEALKKIKQGLNEQLKSIRS